MQCPQAASGRCRPELIATAQASHRPLTRHGINVSVQPSEGTKERIAVPRNARPYGPAKCLQGNQLAFEQGVATLLATAAAVEGSVPSCRVTLRIIQMPIPRRTSGFVPSSTRYQSRKGRQPCID